MSPDEGNSAMSDSQCEFCGNTLHVGHRRDCITMPGGTVRRPDDAHRASGEGGSPSALRASAPEGYNAGNVGGDLSRQYALVADADPSVADRRWLSRNITDALKRAWLAGYQEQAALAPTQADAVAHLARASHSLAPEGITDGERLALSDLISDTFPGSCSLKDCDLVADAILAAGFRCPTASVEADQSRGLRPLAPEGIDWGPYAADVWVKGSTSHTPIARFEYGTHAAEWAQQQYPNRYELRAVPRPPQADAKAIPSSASPPPPPEGIEGPQG